MAERRSQFLINKPLQFRFMAYITATLVSVAAIVITALYFGIWGGVLDAFSDAQIREDLLIASRLSEYETARVAHKEKPALTLSFFRQAEKLSLRQQEIFKKILDDANQKLIPKLLLLLGLIGWGSVYLSHKIAGPLYRFEVSLKELEKGNFAVRIFLRKADEAQFLGTQFNQTAESLDKLISRLKNILRENDSNPERIKIRFQEELLKIKTSVDH